MSADNGVYILKTNLEDAPVPHEYRVAGLQAVENYEWDEAKGAYTDNPDIHIKNARKMWKRSPVFHSEMDALKHAAELLRKMQICEYGISFIEIPRVF